MLESLADFEVAVRDRVFDMAGTGYRFSFEATDAIDASDNDAGALFDQNEDFWLFEADIDDTGRAGPGASSPRRAWGSLSLTLFTKAPVNKVPALRELETVAGWFRDQTVGGIRFRSFLPVQPARIQGFTAYSGVITCAFELKQ